VAPPLPRPATPGPASSHRGGATVGGSSAKTTTT
jgi:hypothetical protein